MNRIFQIIDLKNFGICLLLSLVVVIIQANILSPHLKYGFGDMDWGFLLRYKSLGDNPFSLDKIIQEWKASGVYTYQTYYIGIQEQIFGFNFENFHRTTQFFKMLATISVYPLILILTKRKLAAFVTTLIYAFAFSPVGVMYLVVTSGLHLAILVMNIFLILYIYTLQKKQTKWIILVLTAFFFLLTLFLSTERMYPLIPLVILVEIYFLWQNNFSRQSFWNALKRLSLLIGPIFLAVLIKPYIITQFFVNTKVIFQKIVDGNWQLMLTPFASLGSMFLPNDYWQIFGSPTTLSLKAYLNFFLNGPFLIFGLITIFLSFFIAKRPFKFAGQTLFLYAAFGLTTFLLSVHRLSIAESLRVHFDNYVIIPVLIGGYILSLGLMLFKEWLDQKNILLLGASLGIMVAFIFIFMTWIPSDLVLVFMGVHRYLTIPTIGACLLIACLLILIFDKLKDYTITKKFAWMVFLVIIPMFIISSKVINNYFMSELSFTGMNGMEQTRMKSELWSNLKNFSTTEPSIIYFDESTDVDDGYFHETTLLAGFNFWMRFRGSEIVDNKLTPPLLRSNLLCPGIRSNCLEKVSDLVTVRNGQRGILYNDMFYNSENFYAFRLQNRRVINITDEIKQKVNL